MTAPSTTTPSSSCTPTPARAKPPPPSNSRRWYAQTGGLGPQPLVLFTSFETHTDLTDVLNQIGQVFAPALQASGIEWHALNDNAARRSLVLQVLQQIPVLWIWDNVEPVAGFPAGTESAWTPAEQADLADFLKQIVMAKATQPESCSPPGATNKRGWAASPTA